MPTYAVDQRLHAVASRRAHHRCTLDHGCSAAIGTATRRDPSPSRSRPYPWPDHRAGPGALRAAVRAAVRGKAEPATNRWNRRHHRAHERCRGHRPTPGRHSCTVGLTIAHFLVDCRPPAHKIARIRPGTRTGVLVLEPSDDSEAPMTCATMWDGEPDRTPKRTRSTAPWLSLLRHFLP
jgi:hypothetical protein